jgi:polysaccharide pyruvyl transferase WcaK-like protein
MLLLVGTTRLARKPVMIYAASARPLTSSLGRLLARASVGLTNLVTVREAEAVDRLRSLGTRKPIHLFTDPVVTLEPVDEARVATILSEEGIEVDSEPLVAICPRFFVPDPSYRVHHFEEFPREAVENYHQVLAQAADWLASVGRVVFVPFNTESPDDDREGIHRVQDLMDSADQCHVIDRQYGPREICGVLKQCELVLAVRLHAAIMASSVLTPMVAVAYGPKTEGFMRCVGQGANVMRLEALRKQDLLLTLDRVWNNRLAIRQELAIRMEGIRDLAVRNAETAASLIE